jgi:hypothetical protein
LGKILIFSNSTIFVEEKYIRKVSDEEYFILNVIELIFKDCGSLITKRDGFEEREESSTFIIVLSLLSPINVRFVEEGRGRLSDSVYSPFFMYIS